MKRDLFSERHEAFRVLVRDFISTRVQRDYPSWEAAGHVPRELYRELGRAGIIGINMPVQFGGGGHSEYLYNAIIQEEAARALITLGTLRSHMDVVLPYFLGYATAEQQRRWFPKLATGDFYTAISITEPDTGSDLAAITTKAVRDGDDYVLNGVKTFVTGGLLADLIIVVARTAPASEDRHRGLTLLVVETEMAGVTKGPLLKKVGLAVQDTVELFFDGVRVPIANRLGDEGAGFGYLGHNLPEERLAIAVGCVSQARAALNLTVAHVSTHSRGGQPHSRLQNTRFQLAATETEIDAAQAVVDRALAAHGAGQLTPVDAAKAKLFASEVQGRALDRCMQLVGTSGYLADSPLSRLYRDGRVSRIYGGTSEVMKLVISKAMGL